LLPTFGGTVAAPVSRIFPVFPQIPRFLGSKTAFLAHLKGFKAI
jgi:hypothetical protein